MTEAMKRILLICLAICSAACSSEKLSAVEGQEAEEIEEDTTNMNIPTKGPYTVNSTVGEVVSDPAFGDFGALLFPVDRQVSSSMTLDEVSTSSVYVWYHYIRPEMTVDIINTLHDRAEAGEQIFYRFYTDAEISQDPEKQYTGLFFFKAEGASEAAPFAICNAGGGFMYVGAMHDSFPHALAISRSGLNAFSLIYRPDTPFEDLARAIIFIHDHASELGVKADGYSLWGGSAGARMAATLGNLSILRQLTGRSDIPQAAAVIMQYTGYSTVSEYDAATYANVGTSDGIASWRTMQNRLNSLSELGIPTEFHSYEGLPHGFGLGIGTVAEGWIVDAINFWKRQLINY